jgi:hypothetical protein
MKPHISERVKYECIMNKPHQPKYCTIRVDNTNITGGDGHIAINSRSGLADCAEDRPWYIGMPTVVPARPGTAQQYNIELQNWGGSL